MTSSLPKRKRMMFLTVAAILLLAFEANTYDIAFASSTPPIGSAYYRPFNLLDVIGHNGNWNLTETPQQVISQFQNFPQQPTMIGWVMTDTNYTTKIANDPALSSFIDNLLKITPHICFGVGDPTWNLNNATTYKIAKAFAQQYRNLGTDCLSFHNFGQIILLSGDAPVLNLLGDMNSMGFAHIFTTNYPGPQSNGQPWPYIDAVMTPVAQSNICQLNGRKMNSISNHQPTATILINYEAPTEIQGLAALSTSQQQISCTSAVAAQQYNFTVPFKWAPPWVFEYDPYVKGTLTWIANELASIDPIAPPAAALSVIPLAPANGATGLLCNIVLKVKVTDQTSGALVSGATVTFYLNGSPLSPTATTNLNGVAKYSFCPASGSYSWYATASASGYSGGLSPTWTFKY